MCRVGGKGGEVERGQGARGAIGREGDREARLGAEGGLERFAIAMTSVAITNI